MKGGVGGESERAVCGGKGAAGKVCACARSCVGFSWLWMGWGCGRWVRVCVNENRCGNVVGVAVGIGVGTCVGVGVCYSRKYGNDMTQVAIPGQNALPKHRQPATKFKKPTKDLTTTPPPLPKHSAIVGIAAASKLRLPRTKPDTPSIPALELPFGTQLTQNGPNAGR